MRHDLFGLDPSPDNEEAKGEVTLTLVVHGDVGISVKVSETGTARQCCFPRSKIKIEPTGKTTHRVGHPKYAICEITMPEWLAKDRGLI